MTEHSAAVDTSAGRYEPTMIIGRTVRKQVDASNSK